MPLEIDVGAWEEFERRARNLTQNFEHRKQKQLHKMGRILQAEVKKQITGTGAVDTGRLRASITVENVDSDSVIVGTNVEYAKFVNDGHMQHRRFVSGRWRANGTFEYIPYPANNGQGMMLTEKFIAGKKFMEKSIYRAKPKIVASLQAFMEEIEREWNS